MDMYLCVSSTLTAKLASGFASQLVLDAVGGWCPGGCDPLMARGDFWACPGACGGIKWHSNSH